MYRRESVEALRKLRSVVDAVRLIDDSMPIQTFAVLLDIARHPNSSVNEIASRTGLAQSSASRNVAALSDRHWQKKPGLGLVELVIDPNELRRKNVSLTAKGERFMTQICSHLLTNNEE